MAVPGSDLRYIQDGGIAFELRSQDCEQEQLLTSAYLELLLGPGYYHEFLPSV
jgi:hypothetical protein